LFVLPAACKQKFIDTPGAVPGAAINGKLTELRLKHKKLSEAVVGDADGNIDQLLDEWTADVLSECFWIWISDYYMLKVFSS
jgi:hypothetical protein